MVSFMFKVLKILDSSGEMTAKQIAEATGITETQVYSAILNWRKRCLLKTRREKKWCGVKGTGMAFYSLSQTDFAVKRVRSILSSPDPNDANGNTNAGLE